MKYQEFMTNALDIYKDRSDDYGDETELFECACSVYNLITGDNLSPWQATMFMHSLKLVRIKKNKKKLDNYGDGVNYLAFSAQFAQAKPGRVFVSAPTPLGPTDQVEDDIKRMAQMFAPVKPDEPQA